MGKSRISAIFNSYFDITVTFEKHLAHHDQCLRHSTVEEAAQKMAQEKKMAAHANERLLAARPAGALHGAMYASKHMGSATLVV